MLAHRVGAFTLIRRGPKLWIRHGDGEGGFVSLSAFEREVCEWGMLQYAVGKEGIEEMVRDFYAANF